jgi:hypothetical protein
MKSSALARLILVQIVANVEGFHNFLAPSARGFALHATSDGQTVPMLKEKCRALGLKVSGTKAELIERLNSGSSSPSNPTAAAPPRAQPAEGGAPREKVASTPAVISDALADVLPAAAPKLSEALKPPRASPAKRKGGKVHERSKSIFNPEGFRFCFSRIRLGALKNTLIRCCRCCCCCSLNR